MYFYGIKIQTNIKQILVEEYTEKLQFLKKRNFFNWAGSDSGPLYCSHATCICDTTPPASLRSKNTGDVGGEMAVALGGGPSSSFLCFSTFFFFSSSIFLFFFLSVLSSFPLLFCSFLFLPSALSLPCIYRQKIEGRALLPLPSRGTRIGWPGRPHAAAPEPSKGYVPSIFPPRGKQVGSFCQDRQKGAQQFVDNRAQHFVVCLFNHFIL